ncbi:MAG: hypothetical protein ACK2T0_12960 [Anaerolineales bacterium]|jgi:hypothetical protein
MKIRSLTLRLWITLTSVFSFLVGLAMLAHAPKPVPPSSRPSQNQSVVVAPLQTLVPLAPLDLSGYFANGGIQVQQFNVQDRPTPVPPPAPVFVQPQFTTVQQQPSKPQKQGKQGNQSGGGAPSVSTGGS